MAQEQSKNNKPKAKLVSGADQHVLTLEEQKAGGRASVEKRRQKKRLSELIDIFGNLDVKSENTKKMMKDLGIDPDDFSNDMAIVVSQFQQALRGNTKAFNAIRDTRGQTPDKNINVHGDITPVGLSDLTPKKPAKK